MRILHTSDWHLGKVFHEYSLIEDQRFVLKQIIETLKKGKEENRPFSALLVSGDIYDRSVPSGEASDLLNDFLTEVSDALPELHIFMISGNHDSAVRLSFASSFLAKHKIHLVTDTSIFLEPVILGEGNSRTAFYQLPFLYPASIKVMENDGESSERILRSQQELFEEAAKQIVKNHKENYEDMPFVLNAHLFTAGSSADSSERSCIGTAEQVDVSLFKDFTYCAFGHIHKTQACDKAHRCYYSGALLPYNFDDNAETVMLDVEIKSGDNFVPAVKKVPFKLLHKITKLEGDFSSFIDAAKNMELVKKHKDDFVQITLTDKVEPVEPFARLKNIFPNLLQLSSKQRSAVSGNLSIQNRRKAIKSKDFSQIFSQFLSDISGNSSQESSLFDDENDSGLIVLEKELFKSEVEKFEKKESEK